MHVSKMIIVVCFIYTTSCTRVDAQPAIARPFPELPVPNTTVQKWLRSLTDSIAEPNNREFFQILGEVFEAKSTKKLTNETWLQQTLFFISTSGDEGTNARAFLLLSLSGNLMEMGSGDSINALTPYLESTHPNIARQAFEILRASGLLTPNPAGGNPISTLEFNGIWKYLRGLNHADPSWELINMMYGANADAALRTAADVYLTGEALRLAGRQHTELTILRLSLRLAIPEGDEQRVHDLNQKIAAKLSEMANHPHWCVRAYALAVISAGVSRASPATDWASDTTVPERLMKDSNPYISQSASGILARIKAANSAK